MCEKFESILLVMLEITAGFFLILLWIVIGYAIYLFFSTGSSLINCVP